MISNVIHIYRRVSSIRFLRFAIVGALSSGIYAIVVILLVHSGFTGSAVASALGYAAAIPLNYVGQRIYTFRSEGRVGGEFARFLAIQLMNIAISVVTMLLTTQVLGLSYLIGIAFVITVIPIASYTALALLVFFQSPQVKYE